MRLLVLEIFFLIISYTKSIISYLQNLGGNENMGTKTWSSLMAFFQFYPIKLPSTVGLLTILGANK